MIYIDGKFRFYDDAKDLAKFPELKPIPEAVPLTDEQVTEITANIKLWRWHPLENRPYKLPDCDKKYWKTVDGVILEMSVEEKAAVDQAEADALAAQEAARQVEEAATQAAAASKTAMSSLPGWATWSADEAVAYIDQNVTDLASAKTVQKAMAKAIIYLRDHSRIVR